MNKPIAAILGSVCFFWISSWSWFINDKSETEKNENNLPTTSLSISDSEFSFSADDIFSFHQSDAVPVIPGDNLALLQELARYLAANPERELELNGLFTAAERNKTPHPNLGIARAKAIEKVLLEEGTPKKQLIVASTSVQNLYLMNGRILGGVNFIFSELEKKEVLSEKTAEKKEVKKQEKVNQPPPAVAKEDAKGLKLFYYKEKVYKLDEAHRPFLDSLRRAMRKNPNETVIISGYSTTEEERAVSGNLAELRAMAVRRYLVDNGLRRKQIVVVSHPGTAGSEKGQRVELKVERE